MKTKGKLGLAGILLGSALAISNPLFSQKKERNYLPETMHNVEYIDNEANKTKYNVEVQIPFKGEGGYFYRPNPNVDEGELGFTVTPEKQSLIWESLNSNQAKLTGKEYIPSRLYSQGKVMSLFEITDERINKKIKRKLGKNFKKSENSFGYSFDITDKTFEKILPQQDIANKKYLYFDMNGVKILKIQDGVLKKTGLSGPENSLPVFYIPLNQENLEYTTNPHTNNLIISSPIGIFTPIPEETQININLETGEYLTNEQMKQIKEQSTHQTQPTIQEPKKNLEQSLPKDEKTDYMKYRERLEKERLKPLNQKQDTTITKQDTVKTKQDSTVYHTIKPGDTFYNLADRYWGTGKEADEIQKLNPNIHPDSLKIGQKIRVK
jgi:LysM repeat protein